MGAISFTVIVTFELELPAELVAVIEYDAEAVTAEGVPEITQPVDNESPVGRAGLAAQEAIMPPGLVGDKEDIAEFRVKVMVEGE